MCIKLTQFTVFTREGIWVKQLTHIQKNTVECKTVIFTEWIMRNNPTHVEVLKVTLQT